MRIALPAAGLGLCNAVYVDDVVSALMLAAEHDAAIGEMFLISGSTPVTWREFYVPLKTWRKKRLLLILMMRSSGSRNSAGRMTGRWFGECVAHSFDG